jgi:hypothetical protein
MMASQDRNAFVADAQRQSIAAPIRSLFGVILGLSIAAAASGCDLLLGRKLNPEYCRSHPNDRDCPPMDAALADGKPSDAQQQSSQSAMRTKLEGKAD